MTSISGMTACGKRGGPTLIETVRVDPEKMTCPDGYSPCSEETAATETVCWLENESKRECPILDIKVISVDKEQLWIDAGYETTPNTYPARGTGNSASKIAFSKETSNRHKGQSGTSREPVISSVLNTYIPCYGYDSDRLILSSYQMDQIQSSIEKDDPL